MPRCKRTDLCPELLAPGLIGERARRFLDMADPTDLQAELATARALLELECELRGAEYQAAIAAQATGQPYKDPRISGILSALAQIERITSRMVENKYLDSIPADRFLAVMTAIRAVIDANITSAEVRKRIIEGIQQLELTE